MSIKPRHDNVVIQPIEEKEKKIGGIVIPQREDKLVPDQGKIYAVGKSSDLKKGDIVIFNKFSSKEFFIKEKSYYICSDEEVLAIL